MATEEIQKLETVNEEETIDNPMDDDPIQAPKTVKPEKIDRRKRGSYERTEKQISAFEATKKIRDEKRAIRKEQKKICDDANKKILEEKIVERAVKIKKKQILKEKVLDNLSDDDDIDIPIEIVQKIRKKYPSKTSPIPKEILPIKARIEPEKPMYIFI